MEIYFSGVKCMEQDPYTQTVSYIFVSKVGGSFLFYFYGTSLDSVSSCAGPFIRALAEPIPWHGNHFFTLLSHCRLETMHTAEIPSNTGWLAHESKLHCNIMFTLVSAAIFSLWSLCPGQSYESALSGILRNEGEKLPAGVFFFFKLPDYRTWHSCALTPSQRPSSSMCRIMTRARNEFEARKRKSASCGY